MQQIEIINIRQRPSLIETAADWQHKKWNVPRRAYFESMKASLNVKTAIPQWYAALDGGKIIGGLGVIENDFHDRKDLSPNVCAVFVEENYRCQGIAGKLLKQACRDMKQKGVDTLYLLTDHDSFYERYGWIYLCQARGEGEEKLSRIYMHQEIN